MNILNTHSIHPSQIKPKPELGFGETCKTQSQASTTKQRVHAIAVTILIALALIAVGAFLGALLTAPISIPLSSMAILSIGTGSGVGLGSLSFIGMAIITVINRNTKVPQKVISHLVNPQAPKLGEMTANSILPTEHAKESYEWKLELISKAEQSLEISGNFLGGGLFRKALHEIDKSLERSKSKDPSKSQPKLQVHLTGSYGVIEAEDYILLEKLTKKWPKNFHFLQTTIKMEVSPAIRTIENHVKLMVADEKYFILGGSALQHEMTETAGDTEPPEVTNWPAWKTIGLAQSYRDMDFVGKGPMAKTLRLEFHKLWAIWSYKMASKTNQDTYLPIDPSHPVAKSDKWKKEKARVVKDVQAKALISDPEKPNAITQEHLQMIRSAKKTVQIAGLTFNGAEVLHDELIHATQKGVDVSVITNGYDKNSPWNSRLYVRANYPRHLPLMMGKKITSNDTKTKLANEFSKKTVAAKVYEYAVPRVQYHKKITLIDDDTVIGGTYNYSIKSHGIEGLGGDYEMALTMKSKQLTHQVSRILEKDRLLSRQVGFDKAYDYYHNIPGRIHGQTISYLLA